MSLGGVKADENLPILLERKVLSISSDAILVVLTCSRVYSCSLVIVKVDGGLRRGQVRGSIQLMRVALCIHLQRTIRDCGLQIK